MRFQSFQSPFMFWIAVSAVLPAAFAQDVRVNQDPPGLITNETSLALNPVMPGNLFMAYNDQPYAGGPGLGISFTTNFGATWQDRQLLPPPGLVDAFDPVAAFDSIGIAFAANINTDGIAGGASGLFLHRSNDGGNSWVLMPSPIDWGFGNLRDKPHMTADRNSFSPYRDRLHCAWIRDFALTGPFSDIYATYVTGAGVNVAPPQRINDAPPGVAMANGPNVAVALDGTVYVIWLDFPVTSGGQVPGTLWLDQSIDGGVTWGVDRPVRTILTLPNALSDFRGGADVVARSYPSMAISPTNRLELYVVYAEDPDGPFVGDQTDVFFIKSLDGGFTWTPPLRLNQFVGGHEFEPWIAVKPDGTIDVAWYESPPTPLGPRWSVMITRSIDRGLTFGKPIPISDVPFASPATPWGQPWMGEYLALVVDASMAYVGFTSSVTDPRGDVFFDRIENHLIPSGQPCPGDLDGDRDVDSSDLGILLSAWMSSGAGDLDGDGDTDSSDLGILLANWGRIC
ncbi:MAG: sialidase family protein [Phycisphaerae bacterium]